ncbi:MAG: alpha-L-fucosidase [Anaerolineae bacterium]|nr:alpha-L-fucosidase [Anaerolineae bacterium]
MTHTTQDRIFEAAHVCPSTRQLVWQRLELMAFFHFTVNTFTGQEWGDGTEDPRVFAPTHLDPRQWLCIARDAGIKLAILTAKHHDGFCLWPSRYTEHSVKNSPYKHGKGDVVREFVEACRAFDVKVGLYLSPWDRHEATYGTDAYNDYFKRQLTELLTQYGPIAEVWFDGACGEGPNGKRQVYDWEGYYRVIRTLQPEAVIAISGPDVRWVGNEDGIARENEWSVVPVFTPDRDIAESQLEMNRRWTQMDADKDIKTGENLCGFATNEVIANEVIGNDFVRPDIGDACVPDLGSRARILRTLSKERAERLIWYPAECDVSIRPGWFYHASQDKQVKTPEMLVDLYFKSVGRNAALLLNLPPDTRGLIHEQDVKHLLGMRRLLDEIFARNLASGTTVTASHAKEGHPAQATLDGNPDTYWTTEDWQETATLDYDLGEEKTFSVILLQEYIAVSQRIEQFVIEAHTPHGWETVASGGTVGYKRLLRCQATTTDKVRVRIEGARFAPTLSNFGLF